MANDTTITVIGNLTDHLDLRFTPSGAAVANFRVASTPRYLDRTSGEWRDGEPLFLSCHLWRDPAENAAESLTRGTRVIVTGRLRQRSYETSEGEKRTVVELEVDEIGPSLRYARATVKKMARTGGPAAPETAAPRSNGDAWATSTGAGRSGADFTEEPPF
ncbi:single-stranded DNA-binding protein [Actinoplanes sp. NPDC026623]|uniref:single-stranded DNA-binding protein n=1 Tax=Actinoplanes sp. NPDC026623 TaxID=3155610 RepID=UPI00340A2DC7